MTTMDTGAQRVQRRRDKLRAAGLRPWLPDTGAAGLAEECARQAGLIRDAGRGCAADDEAWRAISDTAGWTG